MSKKKMRNQEICYCGNFKNKEDTSCNKCWSNFYYFMKKRQEKMSNPEVCDCGNFKNKKDMVCNECWLDLHDLIKSHYFTFQNDGNLIMVNSVGKLEYSEFYEDIRLHGVGPVGKCAICGRNYIFGGTSPKPVIIDDDARCCVKCEKEVVLVRRKQSFTLDNDDDDFDDEEDFEDDDSSENNKS